MITRLLKLKAERNYLEGLRTNIVIGLFFSFCLQLRHSGFYWIISDRVICRIGRKWKRSDSHNSNFMDLTTPIFNFHYLGRKCFSQLQLTLTPLLLKTSLELTFSMAKTDYVVQSCLGTISPFFFQGPI